MDKKMLRIGFLLGSPDINGGTYVIYEHGSYLTERGYDVFMLTQETVSADRYQWHPKAQTLGWMTLEEAEQTRFDIVFATYWLSPFLLTKLTARHFAYFIQSIESRFFEVPDPTHHDKRDLDIWKSYCESTYSLNIPVITEAKWIQRYLYENYNRQSYLVRNGIRKDLYRGDGSAMAERESGRLRVLVEGPVDVFYKNVPKSIELCRMAGADEVWLLTSSAVDSYPGVDRVFSRVPIQDTPTVYRSCDVLVKLSYVEGMFGPPLEMFHCGGTAIVYDVTGHDEYIVHDQNSYVVAKDDDQKVVDYLQKLKQDESLLQRLKEGACETAAAWPDWGEAANQFEKAVQQIVEQQPVSPGYLQKWTAQRIKEKEQSWILKEIKRFSDREEKTGQDSYDRNNFVQVYHKAEGQQIDPEQVKWLYYTSDEPAELSTNLTISGLPFWIRIDPSVRVGIVLIDSIKVTNGRTKDILLNLQHAEDFDDLHLDGTIKRIGWTDKAAFVSYGYDPWFYLPQITEGEIGDELELKIQLLEIGITQFANRYSIESAGRASRKTSRLNRLKQMLQK